MSDTIGDVAPHWRFPCKFLHAENPGNLFIQAPPKGGDSYILLRPLCIVPCQPPPPSPPAHPILPDGIVRWLARVRQAHHPNSIHSPFLAPTEPTGSPSLTSTSPSPSSAHCAIPSVTSGCSHSFICLNRVRSPETTPRNEAEPYKLSSISHKSPHVPTPPLISTPNLRKLATWTSS
jgi:hypothetical protein